MALYSLDEIDGIVRKSRTDRRHAELREAKQEKIAAKLGEDMVEDRRRFNERKRIQRMLAADNFDGMRFRFYFQSREGKDLDQWRREIDTLMHTVTKVKIHERTADY